MSILSRLKPRGVRGPRPEVNPQDVVLEQLLRARWSCRAFLPASVPSALIERMLSLAQRAPSWCNTQPWQVEVTSGGATEQFRGALLRHIEATHSTLEPDYPMPVEYTGLHRERRRESGWQLYDAVGIARGDREASARQAAKNFELFGAPHVAIVTTAGELGVYGAIDTGIYTGALLLAAQALGIAAVPQAAIARFAPFVRAHFGMDSSRKVLLAVSFGYADASDPANSYRTARADLSEVVRFWG